MYHHKLLDQAVFLLQDDKEENLRRCASSIYYSAFHFLTENMMDLVSQNVSTELKFSIRRMMTHKQARAFCETFRSEKSIKTSKHYNSFTHPIERDIIEFARTFCVLYENREEADYDLSFNYLTKEIDLEVHIQEIREIIEAIEATKPKNFYSFLFLMFFQKSFG